MIFETGPLPAKEWARKSVRRWNTRGCWAVTWCQWCSNRLNFHNPSKTLSRSATLRPLAQHVDREPHDSDSRPDRTRCCASLYKQPEVICRNLERSRRTAVFAVLLYLSWLFVFLWRARAAPRHSQPPLFITASWLALASLPPFLFPCKFREKTARARACFQRAAEDSNICVKYNINVSGWSLVECAPAVCCRWCFFFFFFFFSLLGPKINTILQLVLQRT